MPDDPRLVSVSAAAAKMASDYNYDPHFAGFAERILMESRLFLARWDALQAHLQLNPSDKIFKAGEDIVPRKPTQAIIEAMRKAALLSPGRLDLYWIAGIDAALNSKPGIGRPECRYDRCPQTVLCDQQARCQHPKPK